MDAGGLDRIPRYSAVNRCGCGLRRRVSHILVGSRALPGRGACGRESPTAMGARPPVKERGAGVTHDGKTRARSRF